MPTLPPADIGAPVSEIDTPALIVDLDALTRNLEKMAALAKRLGVRLRPHAKTHKSSVIAARQIALGAVGVCCQKVSEAEALVAGGIGDVLVTNEIVGARKIARLAHLARQARIGVYIDEVRWARIKRLTPVSSFRVNEDISATVGTNPLRLL
jgi:3-hydroxy-D-aspartate aldolase